ncbi:glycoside hydrolase family 28 protein [Coniophora puteana RWD-64-598 SS2]|uniref:endo-polygalacturonase n=1 Tax=Coniophora puteana (strain RWD-64-598) TaxID=741705 RepID=A0A5M3MFU8_CONPW|nr:glycoside hydrolase family 28 protein [Coniophora puteana RWD-64-598 SS2]EIW78033.1 glycoside hydrolase family 28 protein [Coniophora puteana RWD-64-598 SS2]
MITWTALVALVPFVAAAPASSDCTGTISSLDDVADAVQCTTVNVNSFTVPAGETLSLSLLQGTTVNIQGNIAFGNQTWDGPLFEVKGDDITFNGNNYIFDGGGPFYWDGLGGSGGNTKPDPMMKIEMSGTVTNVKVINSPERCFSVDPPAALLMSGITVDNSQGNQPNSQSDGKVAGHNTDGFDVSGDDITITKSTVINQDDCLAINRGNNIVFSDNYCATGHGISIGSINSNTVVSGMESSSLVIPVREPFRIKTDAAATNSSVSNVTYSNNKATGIYDYGVLITQSYPSSFGTPGTGVIISDINFTGGATTVETDSNATMVAIDCGEGSCTGTWDWSELTASGGKTGAIDNCTVISGFTQ